MQSVSDDDVRKRLLEKPRFVLAAKGVFRLGRCYLFWQGIPGLRASNRESTATHDQVSTAEPQECFPSMHSATRILRPSIEIKVLTKTSL